jgi:tetraacyldisaccharide 4'-kinase
MTWERVWYGPTSWAALLLLAPLAALYAVGTWLWHLPWNLGVRHPHRVPGVRVISVGNLVAGGAGKTPVVIHLANAAVAQGARVAVLTRGYGRASREPVSLSAQALLPLERAGDEPRLIARACPGVTVWVASDRVAAAYRAAADGANVLILDDGFQHRRLHRDVNVLVDGGLGNGWLLPAGPLREASSARRRATLVWGRDGLPGDIEARHVLGTVRRPDGSTHSARDLHGVSLVVLTAIARPQRFLDELASLGARVVAAHLYADHHSFSPSEVAAAVADAGRLDATLLTTAKDAERLSIPVHVALQTLEILRGAELIEGTTRPP